MAIDAEPQGSVQEAEKIEQTLLQRAQRFLVAALRTGLTVLLGTQASLPANPPLIQADSEFSEDQNNELKLEGGMPSLAKNTTIQEVNWTDHGVEVDNGLLPPNSYGPEDSQGRNLNEAREIIKNNPHDIRGQADVMDNDGNVIKELVAENVSGEMRLYESRMGENGTFSAFEGKSIIPIEDVSSLASSPDGKIIIAGGKGNEVTDTGYETKIAVSFDGGLKWQNIWNLEKFSGPTSDLIKITESRDEMVFFGNNKGANGVEQFFLHIKPNVQTVKIDRAQWSFQGQPDFNPGALHEPAIVSIEKDSSGVPTGPVKVAANASYYARGGIVTGELNFKTGMGNLTHIGSAMVGGQEVFFSTLRGGTAYKDSQSNYHWVTSETPSWTFFDINLTSKTAKSLNYWEIGLSYSVAIAINLDGKGALHTMAGGIRALDGKTYASLVDVEQKKFVDLIADGSIGQKGLRRKKINGQWGYAFEVEEFGRGFLPEGTSSPLFTNRGLGSEFKPQIPPPPDPKPTPSVPDLGPKYKIFLPNIQKSQ